MKRNILVLLSLLVTGYVSAQEVVSTQGGTIFNANGSIDFTVGEVMINTFTNGTNDLTQGFQQTNWNFVGIEDHLPSYEVTIFPNPTSDVLNIKTSEYQNVNYTLYDGKGQLVLQNKLSAEQTVIQVSRLAPGNYSLVLNNDTQNLKTFLLIKYR